MYQSCHSPVVATGGVFTGCIEELIWPSRSMGLCWVGLGFLQVVWETQLDPPALA